LLLPNYWKSNIHVDVSCFPIRRPAVHEWCALNHCAIDSEQGRRAITVSVDLVQITSSETLLDRLVRSLEPPKKIEAEAANPPTPTKAPNG